jgi:molybdopterin molybdotransferase
MIDKHDITGLILAGGRASRMGGVDKGLQNHAGAPLAMHALMRLGHQVGEVLINANRNLGAYEAFGVPVWPDANADYAGPLSGFLAGLEHCDTPYLVTVPCDSPVPRRPGAALGRRTDRTRCRDRDGRHTRGWRTAGAAGVLPDEDRVAREPDPIHAGRAAQDRQVDGPAPLRRGPVRRRACVREREHAGSGYDPNALPVAQAQDFIARLVPRVQAIEKLALRSALGRVLARDIVSAIDVPAHDNSAMDGYALCGADLATDAPTVLRVTGSGFAGQADIASAGAGECVRIMTGAVMPAGLDTVVPQEFVQVDGEYVHIPAGVVRGGDNRRLAGEDMGRGEVALAAGRVLRPADLGMLASLGQAEVPVRRRLRVAFFSTATNCA